MNELPVPIESPLPHEGALAEDEPDAKANEWAAWAMRRRLPSELAQKPFLRWPSEVAFVTGLPDPTLKKLRAAGDHPKLYAIGRALFTTHADLRNWFVQHELDAGEKLRPATVPKGTKLGPRRQA